MSINKTPSSETWPAIGPKENKWKQTLPFLCFLLLQIHLSTTRTRSLLETKTRWEDIMRESQKKNISFRSWLKWIYLMFMYSCSSVCCWCWCDYGAEYNFSKTMILRSWGGNWGWMVKHMNTIYQHKSNTNSSTFNMKHIPSPEEEVLMFEALGIRKLMLVVVATRANKQIFKATWSNQG